MVATPRIVGSWLQAIGFFLSALFSRSVSWSPASTTATFEDPMCASSAPNHLTDLVMEVHDEYSLLPIPNLARRLR